MGDHTFLKVMPKRGVVIFGKQGEVVAEVHWTLRDIQEDRHRGVPFGITVDLIRCP